MHKFKITNKATGFITNHSVNVKSESVAIKIINSFFNAGRFSVELVNK